ncbi:hypothetical protein [Roseobacter sp. HKCCA0434]|uniref:hypothetical protein n=1 Tax=Roseobacter sp. HKCCA0434 TaxID=3079297 RepID=UPI002905CD72|nr:hypothetical protein [Roseobacter sp. HKCCA0434]
MSILSSRHAVHTFARSNAFPHIPVIDVTGHRRAQIVARIMFERTGIHHLNCDPAMAVASFKPGAIREMSRDGATALLQIAEAEMRAEAADNPEALPKWHLLIFDHGASTDVRPRFQYSLYLDEDIDVIRRCRANPSLIETIPVFAEAIDHREAEALFDAFVAERMAQTGEGDAA